MSSITEEILKSYFDEFIDNVKRLDTKIELINNCDTNIDMMLRSFLILRNVSDSFNFMKTELIKYIYSHNKYICDICRYSTDNPYAYDSHMSKHSKYNETTYKSNKTVKSDLENREYYMRSTKNCIIII